MDTRETLLETLRDLELRRDAAKVKLDELSRAIEGIQFALKLTRTPNPNGSGRGDFVQAIRTILLTWWPEIEVKVSPVEEALKRDFPDLEAKTTSISSALARLAEEVGGIIEVAQQGAGRRPTIYKRKDSGGSNPPAVESAA